MLAFKYISYYYLKYFFIILLALIAFLVGFDYMQNSSDLSDSANLILIYLVYKSFYAIDMLLPLSLIFAMISTIIFLIRSNALVSFYSLGYTRIDILRPFLFVSTSIITIFILLHSLSSFSRAYEFSNNIRKNAQYLSPTRDLFFTYKDQYIYFAKMLPLQEKAEGIRVFTIKKDSLKEVLVASSAEYRDGYWVIKEANIINKPDEIGFNSSGIKVDRANNLKVLKGFRPKILDQVYEGKVNFTIIDAIYAMVLLNEQNIDTSSIRSALYRIFIYPFFVPLLVVLIFFFAPISSRSMNISMFSFGAILSTLMVWGILFMLIELSNNRTIPSELGIIFPILILFFIVLREWKKHTKNR